MTRQPRHRSERSSPTTRCSCATVSCACSSDSGFDVVAAVGDAEALLDAATEHDPDLCIVDVRMPPTHTDEGLRAAIEIKRRSPEVAVLVLSQYVEERYAGELLTGNVSGVGYLLKDRVIDVDDFLASLRRVAAGGSAVDTEVISQILGRSRNRAEIDRLTPREREVLTLMAEGLSNAGHRRAARGVGGRGRETHLERVHEARARARGGRPPPSAGGVDVPARRLTRRRALRRIRALTLHGAGRRGGRPARSCPSVSSAARGTARPRRSDR